MVTGGSRGIGAAVVRRLVAQGVRVVLGYFGALTSITLEDYRRVFDVNVAGQLFLVQAAAAAMGDGWRIVVMSSVSGSLGCWAMIHP